MVGTHESRPCGQDGKSPETYLKDCRSSNPTILEACKPPLTSVTGVVVPEDASSVFCSIGPPERG